MIISPVSSGLSSDHRAEGTESSAYNYTYNKIIDYTLKKTVNGQPDEKELQDQIIDIHAKSVIIIPRLCVLFQIFNYAMDVLNECENDVVFDDGYLASREISESVIRKATKIVNKILASVPKSPYYPRMPMLFVEKPACIAACNYYDHLNNTAVILFTLPEPLKDQYTSKKSLSRSRLIAPILSSSVPSTPEGTICLFPFNFFMSGALTSTMPEPLQIKNSPFHNCSHLVEPALINLTNDGILITSDLLVDSKNRHHKSIMKVPIPHDQQKRDSFEAKLKKYNVKLSDYESAYKTSGKPTKWRLSREAVYFYSQVADFVPEYSKYKTDMTETIEQLVKDGHIIETIVDNDIQYAVSPTSTHFRSLPIDTATYEQLKTELPPLLKQKNPVKSFKSQSDAPKSALTQSPTPATPSQPMPIIGTALTSSNSMLQQPSITDLQLFHQLSSSLSKNHIERLFEIFTQTNLNQFATYLNSFTFQNPKSRTSAAAPLNNQSSRYRRNESSAQPAFSRQSSINTFQPSEPPAKKPKRRAQLSRRSPFPTTTTCPISIENAQNQQDMEIDAVCKRPLHQNYKKHKK
ncbi:unnamed protein product [Didymodactylos carnosus]|uniref:Uncharacterized protein n=1 Tax=Didymodactylos carnosus TaxID=1234261 RepID=A0A815V4V9_9BILA|nr:unnamed protein product [Didymodactylos carnosus]CAF4382341.1 unnamed protein product [Didymodactylos carnosus]